jgi:hypothetical protein
VLVGGDFSFLANPFDQVADNQLLVAHIAEFATSAERSPALANFPFLFQRPVSLVTTGDVQLSSDILEPLAGLQRALKAINIPVNIHKNAQKDGDSIVLGTFDPSPDLNAYLKPFKINLSNQNGGLELDGIGMLDSNGLGLLLFNHEEKSNTLVLLVSSAQDLPKFISLVSSGDLSACLLQENIAICNLADPLSGGGFDYYNGGGPDYPTEIPTELPTDAGSTPTEAPFNETPTPSG